MRREIVCSSKELEQKNLIGGKDCFLSITKIYRIDNKCRHREPYLEPSKQVSR